MKIKENIDEYNIESISTIHYTIVDIEKRCNILEHVASIMRRRLVSVSDEFKTVNYERIDGAVDGFIKKMENARGELLELSKSVKHFEEKIRKIWE
ncbi:MAG: hypothetical protein IJA82_01245 [Clostridia bacterium]|nr:hypothetical protein [Clostridia bacterium]